LSAALDDVIRAGDGKQGGALHFGGGGNGEQTDVTYTGNAFRCDDVQTALASAPPPVVR
jgi:hypothetical protein